MTDHVSSTLPADRLIIFARYPLPGHAKTRLIPAVGPVRAASIHRRLTSHTLQVARGFVSDRRCLVEVRFSDGSREQMEEMFGTSGIRYEPQFGIGLGERLQQAVSAAFGEGASRVVVIGTDCPELNADLLSEAFLALIRNDVTLGPARDGGYYLIGLRNNRPNLFQRIDWSTNRVLQQTLAHCRRERLRVQQLPALSDVDHPEDLLALRRAGGPVAADLPASEAGWLSIVVPALNEAQTLETTIQPLRALDRVEVIVADGGSSDATCDIARQLGATVVATSRGRGRQMNAGAALARGEALLFLHADSRLPHGFQHHVWAALKSTAIAGAFRLRIGAPNPGLRWVEWGANLRAQKLQLPYGDQGLFLRSALFRQMEGFQNWPLLEDYDLVRRLKRLGHVEIVPAEIETSPRRWLKRGIVQTTLLNQACLAAYWCGVSPQRIARWYARRPLERVLTAGESQPSASRPP